MHAAGLHLLSSSQGMDEEETHVRQRPRRLRLGKQILRHGSRPSELSRASLTQAQEYFVDHTEAAGVMFVHKEQP
jgi:hypothetical protein